MLPRMLPSSAILLLLLVSTSLAWSKKSSIPLNKDSDESISEESSSDNISLEPSESKSRYKWRQGEGRYILEEDSDNDKGGRPQKDVEYDEHDHHNKKAKISKLESLKPKLKPAKGRHSEKGYIPQKDNDGRFKGGHEKDKEYDDEDRAYQEEGKKSGIESSESKLKSSRYKGRHGEGRYILNEDDHDYDKGGHGEKDEEFVEEKGNEEYNEEEHDRGYHNEDKKLDDETLKEFSIKGTDQEFKEGGASFDKHHKDRASENKENEKINEHDEGEKFGAEALKEHKLGKHREKSVGHKKHGFKNVYHKEEYGDHKTFHDEFLDNDHHHEYDDQHENRKLEGGRFSKGYLREGENKEKDAGDEKHAWGKGGYDSHHDGHYEEGGHITGHKQGHRKREGHHEASGHKHKQSRHKVKKGEAPVHSDHDDYQPEHYARNHKSHGRDSKEQSSDNAGGGHFYNDPESYKSAVKPRASKYPPVGHTYGRLPEEDLEEPALHSVPEPTPVVDRGRAAQSLAPPEHHSFYYRKPQSEVFDQVPLKNEKPVQVPHVNNNPWVAQHSPHIHQNPHHQGPRDFHTGLNNPSSFSDHGHHHQNHGNNHDDHVNHLPHQFVVSQRSKDHQPHDHLQNHPHHSMVSKPYPWWKHSRSQGDPAHASTHHRFGHERSPHHQNTWVPQNKFRYSEPYQTVASQQHYRNMRGPVYHNRHNLY